nr:hypothetical protein [Rhizobium sp. RHZ02]
MLEQFCEGSAGVERLLCEFGRNVIAKQWNEFGRQCSARHQMFLAHIGVRLDTFDAVDPQRDPQSRSGA